MFACAIACYCPCAALVTSQLCFWCDKLLKLLATTAAGCAAELQCTAAAAAAAAAAAVIAAVAAFKPCAVLLRHHLKRALACYF